MPVVGSSMAPDSAGWVAVIYLGRVKAPPTASCSCPLRVICSPSWLARFSTSLRTPSCLSGGLVVCLNYPRA